MTRNAERLRRIAFGLRSLAGKTDATIAISPDMLAALADEIEDVATILDARERPRTEECKSPGPSSGAPP
jgi:hypothetical protein